MTLGWRGWLASVALLSGCATTVVKPPAPADVTPAPTVEPSPPPVLRHFEGRLSVTVQSDPVQHTSAEFELDGDAERGEMKFYGPFGGLALVLQWQPGQAVLIEGNQKRTVPSLEWLMQRLTGASLPIPMVFDWLSGKPVSSDDWWLEPRDQPNARYRALRLQPLPRIELIIAVKKATP